MKLGLMPGTPAAEMRELGFAALQMFFGSNRTDDAEDPSDEEIDATLRPGNLALAAMTLHIDLVGQHGAVQPDIDRAIRMVGRTAALRDRFGEHEKPVLVWHPSGYPDVPGVDDRVVFQGLCAALGQVCAAAEAQDVYLAVELSRACSVYSAESFLRIKDQVASPALRVCLDAANIAPDRTPLERAVRMLGSDVVIAHAKDSHFHKNGEVADYGPVGSGTLDYAVYIRALQQYCRTPYIILEYYQSREQMLHARDTILQYL